MAKQTKQGADMLRTVSMVAALGNLFGDTQKEQNTWKKRFIALHPGIILPADWDDLSEDEKQRRLDGAISVGLKKESD